jgi:hypothetical protein
MRLLLALLLLLPLPSLADDYTALYQAAGWPSQREHFSSALIAAQKRYQNTLPPAVYQSLVQNSNRRFAPDAMDQRAQAVLRSQLANAREPLAFFQTEVGRKVVSAETIATSPAELEKYANGLPRTEAEATRRLLVRHLAQALPAGQAGAEISLALAGVAADSLSSMLPGLFGEANPALGLMEGQRQRIVEQINQDLDNTLLHVYRRLSDAELAEFVEFVQSPSGNAYYTAALAALRAALNPSAANGARSM